MACTNSRRRGQTEAERRAEVDQALQDLAQQIAAGSASVVIGADGAIAFDGWENRRDLTDACAYLALVEQDNWELRQAVQRAEQLAGRPISVNTGTHSHDGGRTWHGGH